MSTSCIFIPTSHPSHPSELWVDWQPGVALPHAFPGDLIRQDNKLHIEGLPTMNFGPFEEEDWEAMAGGVELVWCGPSGVLARHRLNWPISTEDRQKAS